MGEKGGLGLFGQLRFGTARSTRKPCWKDSQRVIQFVEGSRIITVLFTGISMLGFVAVNMVAGLAMGTWPEADACAVGLSGNSAGTWICEGPGYPLFYPPFWIMLFPALLMAVSSAISISLPSAPGAPNSISRFTLWVICLVAAGRSSELVRLVHPVGTQFRRPGTVARFRVF